MYRLSVILFLVFASVGFAQGNKVDLSIDPATAEIGETFEISITSTVTGNIDFGNLPDEFIQDYAVRQGTTQQRDMNGNVIIQNYYVFSGIIKKPGNYTFGPVSISTGNKTYVSNTAVINISPKVKMKSGVVSSKQFRDPAFGVIEVNKMTLYEGEPLLIRSKVYARYKPTHVQNYVEYGINGTIAKYPIGNSSSFKTTIERFRGEDFYAIDHDKNIVFPTGVGKTTIEPFKLNLHQGYQSFPLESSSLTVTVLPLPANPPKDFIGAVGDFTVSRRIPEKKFDQGDVIKIIVTVSGVGNLQNITIPQLNLPKGYTIYGDPVVDNDYSIGVRGAEGKITYEFNVEVSVSGQRVLPPMTITYFDPQREEYVQVSSKSDSLNVKPSKNFNPKPENSEDGSRSTELIVQEFNPRENSGSVEPGSIFGTGIFWGGVTIPVTTAFLFLFFMRTRENIEEKTAAKQVKNKRSGETNKLLSETKALLQSGESKTFYDSLEKTLRSGFAASIAKEEDEVLSKQEIIDHAASKSVDLKNKVIDLLGQCEIAKYSFGLENDQRNEHFKELELILQQLNKRK